MVIVSPCYDSMTSQDVGELLLYTSKLQYLTICIILEIISRLNF